MSGPRAIVDTNVFVAARRPQEPAYAACRRLLEKIDAGEVEATVSTVTLAELRAGLSDPEAEAIWQPFVSHLLGSSNYRVEPVDVGIAEMAGELRRRSRLTLPDAVIVATGKRSGSDFLLTLDREIGRRQDWLSVRSPSEWDRRGLAGG